MKKRTFEDIFRWGKPEDARILDTAMLAFLRKKFGSNLMSAPCPSPGETANVIRVKSSGLPPVVTERLAGIVGRDNINTDNATRIKHSAGQFYLEILKARQGIIDNVPDAIIFPENEDYIIRIIEYCHAAGISIIPCGGRTSVTGAVSADTGGISLDLTRHMNRVIRINEINSTVTVQPGIYGPVLEAELNEVGYTCGHFPQSFEFSTVGGWVMARGAGQASTGYGKIEDMVLALRLVTPRGIITTKDYPAAAIGPDLNQLIIGSEGAFGVLSEVTLKIRSYQPGNSARTAFMFRDFPSAVTTAREIMQGGFGSPHVFRITDPEETDIAFKTRDRDDSLADRILRHLGYRPGERCMMIATVEGDPDYAKSVIRKMKRITRHNRGLYIGRGPVRHWERERFSSPYLREPLMDLGLMVDTVETAVTWEHLLSLWSNVRKYIKSRPNAICMTHLSHCYENGANLYFIFISPLARNKGIEDYIVYHRGIIDTIQGNLGALSHHHGIGTIFAPRLESEIGATGIGLLRSIKRYLDPNGIMNPGKLLIDP